MKHIKKNRLQIPLKEQGKIRSKARQQAKHILSKKFKEEYNKIYGVIFRRLKREYLKELEGGIKNDN